MEVLIRTLATPHRLCKIVVFLLVLWPSGVGLLADESKTGRIADVRVIEVDGVLNVMVASKDKLQVWQVPDKTRLDKWHLVRTWNDFSWLWYGLGEGKHVIVVSKHTAELYKVGKWTAPEMTQTDGLPSSIQSIYNILPTSQGDVAQGIAIETMVDTEGGKESRWSLFFSQDGDEWHRLLLEPGANLITRFTRLGPGEIAVVSGGSGANAGGKIWRIFRLEQDHRWKVVNAPDLSNVVDLSVYDYPHGLAIREAGAPQTNWRYLYRLGADEWRDIHDVIPNLPKDIELVRVLDDGALLAALGRSASTDKEQPGMWYFFRRTDVGSWRPVDLEALPGSPKALFALQSFSADKGLAFQTLDPKTGSHSSDWNVVYRSADGRWTPIVEIIGAAKGPIWAVNSISKGVLGLQSADPSSRFAWQWFAQSVNGWTPLESLIPGLPRSIWDIYAGDINDGIAVQEDVSSSGSGGLSWKWFLPTGKGKWQEISSLLHLPDGFPDRSNQFSVGIVGADDRHFRRDTLEIRGVNDDSVWFLHSGPDWVSIEQMVEKAASQ